MARLAYNCVCSCCNRPYRGFFDGLSGQIHCLACDASLILEDKDQADDRPPQSTPYFQWQRQQTPGRGGKKTG